ncbi:uncharacterized protein GGS22DRAFT_159567 [Annulohypoxylon maeteangense]|uniref:uncharacterized protein n=1 Tax=Annulohypoxylon maeteangense TaxID=1927788 RepID=UPI002007F578|nr:uncharacterized protein GGS22DRAFT_159567 [Annulohypoxylon maeteangense]KAI0885999.1 hypothetical protein GGS22DRAFT_159567 [Annulohypoxylon maeteangense]
MCRGRIIHRLRFAGQRQSIKTTLQTAFYYLKHAEPWKIRNQEGLITRNSFIKRAREVLKLVDSWVKHQTDAELEGLVEGIRCLRQVGHLETLIEEIPDNVMQPNLRDSLINMISKVARYRDAARFLYRIGKTIPLTRKMRAVIVQWPKAAFARPTNSQYFPNLDTTISLVEGLQSNEKGLKRICLLLNADEKAESRRLTREKARDKFTTQTYRTLREAKIHAEIQLLYHCELNIPHNRLPRVVCSSKDACWLCNEFILLYEKIHTPKSHGRLYPGWRLPVFENDDLADRYNLRLQNTFKKSLKTLFSGKKKTLHPYPNESTLLTLYLSDSTLSSVHLPLGDEKGKAVQQVVEEVVLRPEELDACELVFPGGVEAVAEVEEVEETEGITEVVEIEGVERVEDVEDEEQTGDSVGEITSPERMKLEGLQESQFLEETKEVREVVGQVQNVREVEVMTPVIPIDHGGGPYRTHDSYGFPERWSSGCSSSSSEGSITLEFGKVRSKKIWMGNSTPLYNAGPLLNIQVEYAKSQTPEASNNLHKKLSYSLERLRSEDVEKLRDRGVVPIAGAELPDHWVESNTDEEGCIYISNGDTVMKLLLRPILE